MSGFCLENPTAIDRSPNGSPGKVGSGVGTKEGRGFGTKAQELDEHMEQGIHPPTIPVPEHVKHGRRFMFLLSYTILISLSWSREYVY